MKEIFAKYLYKVTFEKIHNDHSRLRDSVIHGYCDVEPTKGQSFVFIGEPRDRGSFRLVNTSPITLVKNIDELYEVETESGSIYHIRLELQN